MCVRVMCVCVMCACVCLKIHDVGASVPYFRFLVLFELCACWLAQAWWSEGGAEGTVNPNVGVLRGPGISGSAVDGDGGYDSAEEEEWRMLRIAVAVSQ